MCAASVAHRHELTGSWLESFGGGKNSSSTGPTRRLHALKLQGTKRACPAAIQPREPSVDIGLMAKKKAKAPRVYRDASSGRFVTKKYAKKHPKTTIKGRRQVASRVDDPSE
jgi:hypothetical protein